MSIRFSAGAVLVVAALGLSPAGAMTLRDAVSQAVTTHPTISAAVHNRDATAYEARQSQGRLLPSIDLSAEIGRQNIDRPNGLAPERNDIWQSARQVTVTVNQTIFNGFERANDIYRNAARIDAAALRILQRSEIAALNAVEAYIDVDRHANLAAIARRNVDKHRSILAQVMELVDGGKAPESDIGQTQERVAAAEAVSAQVQQAYQEAVAKFREAVGSPPGRLRGVPIPSGLPRNRQEAISRAAAHNPGIRAADADILVAELAVEHAKSAYWPTIGLQGTATAGEDLNAIPGRSDELAGKLTLTWNLFSGGIRKHREAELNARLHQAKSEQMVRVRRTGQAIDRAFAAYYAGAARVNVAERQIAANSKVVAAYTEEYRLSKRSLLDLLDAESALFNARFQATSLRAVHHFGGYQLLAAMGALLDHFGVDAPAYAEPFALEKVRNNLFDATIVPLSNGSLLD